MKRKYYSIDTEDVASSSSLTPTACSDFPIELSSYGGSTTTRFDFALDYLNWLQERVVNFNIDFLQTEVRLLKTFVLCATKWRSNHFYLGHEVLGNCESLRCILPSIQDLVSGIPKDIHFAYLTSGPGGAGSEIIRCLENIRLFGTDIKELYITLVDDHYSRGHPRRLMDFLDGLSENLMDLFWFYRGTHRALCDLIEALKEKLMFLKVFINFATMQGVENLHLIDLLIHVQVVGVNAARQIYICWFHRYDEQVRNEMQFEISQLLQNIKPIDPKVRETYIHVLVASKLTRSSPAFTLEKHGHIVAAEFIDHLLDNLMDLLESFTCFRLSVNNQMQKFLEGLTFLKMLLGEWQEKFNVLDDEMKDHIGLVVCDAAILICSLSLNEMKEGLAKEIDIALSHLVKVFEFIMAEVAQIYPHTSSSFSFPKTNELGSIDFLLKYLKELTSCKADSIAFTNDQIHRVQEDLLGLRSILENTAEQRNQNEKLQNLWSRVMELACKAEFVIDSTTMVVDKSEYLNTIVEDFKLMKTEALKIYDSVRQHTVAQRVTNTAIDRPSQSSNILGMNEVLVGLDDEVNTIIERLTRGSTHLDIVSVVGMPGLGKTTLATKVYNDRSITGHFHIRAWCIVSQVYSKHDLFHQILGNTNEYIMMNEDVLAEKVYKRLKGNRYLIVLDDVWDIKALNLLKRSFPDDSNGSRILFTTRLHDLGTKFKSDSKPHYLRPLTDEESWELLQNKLFGKGCCPPTLSLVGIQIAKNCKGLPLTVVIIAGVLAYVDQDSWAEVANNLNSSTVIGSCMKTMELSYKNLPEYLKSCLLYFGAFQEGRDISVRRLLWLWISEGFVQKNEAESLEDVADKHLMDLIGRSLLIVTQQRSIGGVKACRIHDLLHEFCVAKAKEERFLQCFHGYNERFTLSRLYKPYRLCIYSSAKDFKKSRLFFPYLRCLLFFDDKRFFVGEQYSFVFRIFKLLRVLDLRSIHLGQYFPGELELLVHLRYLAVRCRLMSIPSGIANLSKLKTFVIQGTGPNVVLPNSIWNMKKLRQLCAIKSLPPAGFSFPTDNLEASPDLHHLDNFTLAIDLSSQSMEKILKKLPSIRRLKCVDVKPRESNGNCSGTPVLCFVSQLESLHLVGFCGAEFTFPMNLKKLTLSSYKQPWSEMSTIGQLPNLEVLKLLNEALVGETWEINEGEFPKLRFLKLKSLNICRWTCSDYIPCLQKLVLHDCLELEEIPSCLGDSSTIEMIEVRSCHMSAVSSVKQIHEEQMELGNESLRIMIHSED